VEGGGCCLGRPSRDRRVVVRARSMQGLVEGRVAVGNLMVLMRCWVEGLVVGGILGRAEMVSCLTKIVEVREAVDTMGVLRREWVVGA
jgi:hypothetical protein